MDIAAQLEKAQAENDALWKRWSPRADYWHNPNLDRDVWMVDGEVQDVPLTEATLDAVLLREGTGRKVVEVSAPLHLVLGRITGRTPPYVTP